MRFLIFRYTASNLSTLTIGRYMPESDFFTVEVAYALPDRQKIIELSIQPGTTAYGAAVASNIVSFFPGLDLKSSKMGIFGQTLGTKGLRVPEEHELQPGDRVEIYRPLISDPKEVRRRRAAKAEASKKSRK